MKENWSENETKKVTWCWKVDYLLTESMTLWKMNSLDAKNRWAESFNCVFRMAGFLYNNYTQLEFLFWQKWISREHKIRRYVQCPPRARNFFLSFPDMIKCLIAVLQVFFHMLIICCGHLSFVFSLSPMGIPHHIFFKFF